ncbi:LysR family transcriptional regulator [Luxibacter massiliensis]|uniref:LysR family transcriptional regulator n=1 Tax=Luxibacter massiliensis TaxID=2219695 RepID=UPI000F05DF11|nr:LysR family transcriptional regulator [Luxibacter massiliensis]
MEIRVLRYFLTVVREESITKAADVLHITQPTLSRQLAQMEEGLGVQLFIRGTRKIVLTNEGMLMRRRAEEILELVDKTERELVEQEEELEGIVAIGCGDLKAVQLLPELIRSFRQLYPKVTFELYTATADHVKDRIDRGLTDIGLLLEPINMDKYDFIRLKQKETWVVSMHPDAPLAKKDYVTAKDLEGLPLIMPHRLNVQSELASWFGESYEKLNVVFKSNLPANGSIMVYNRLAYALIVTGSIDLWDKDKLIYRPLYPELTATSALAWKRHQPFGKAAEKFIEHIKSNL